MEIDNRVIRVEYTVPEPLIPSEWAISHADFIDYLRHRLKEFFPGSPPLPLGDLIPQLPTLRPSVTHIVQVFEYLELWLKSPPHNVVLRIDPYNMRLYGYQQLHIDDIHSFEFGIDDTTTPHHLIYRSSLLGFHGDYHSLEKAAGRTKEQIGIGPNKLVSAIKALDVTSKPHLRARALIIINRMIIDAITSPCISKHLVPLFSKGSIRSQKSPKNAQKNKKCYMEVCAFASKRTFMTESAGEPPHPLAPCGKPLAEVFSVVIDDMIGRADLYGRIHVEAGLHLADIYNTRKDDSVSIPEAATSTSLLLTGPSRSIRGYDSIGIYLVLKDRNRHDGVIMDDVVAWSSFTGDFDTLLAEKVSSEFCSATVNYVVLSHAVQATLEVTLLRNNCGDGDNCTRAGYIHGHIHAGSNCGTDDSSYWSVLFLKEKEKKKKNDNGVVLTSGQLVPLSRSVVSVKLSCLLKVEAELFGSGVHLSSGEHADEIANGTVELLPKSSGTSKGEIPGKYGRILVKVTWGRGK